MNLDDIVRKRKMTLEAVQGMHEILIPDEGRAGSLSDEAIDGYFRPDTEWSHLKQLLDRRMGSWSVGPLRFSVVTLDGRSFSSPWDLECTKHEVAFFTTWMAAK